MKKRLYSQAFLITLLGPPDRASVVRNELQMRVLIPHTHRAIWPGSSFAENVESSAEVRLTAWLHPKRGGDLAIDRASALGATPPLQRSYERRSSLLAQTDADPADRELFRAYCAGFDIHVVESHWRSMVVSGPLDRLIEAFGATVAIFTDGDGNRFRHRSGSLHVPPEIATIVSGIFGLHLWPRSSRLGPLQRHSIPLSASDVIDRYQFPDADGTGVTVGIVQFRGEFKADDFSRCMAAQGVTSSPPIIKRIDNAALQHDIQTTKDLEAALDIQIISALAPGARTVIYQAPDSERGFLDAIRTAIFDDELAPSILSISYGWPEQLWTPAAVSILEELFAAAALLGVSVFCASGDNGAELQYDGRPHVLAPASSPFVHACGATTIVADSPTLQETVWENTGGGFSERFGAPSWQKAMPAGPAQSAALGRGVPDIAAQESPGYLVYLDGVELAVGGTSAVAPMWAALAARVNQRLGTPIGFFAPLLYASHPTGFREIVDGSNGHFEAHAGWNACTGLGVPLGRAIEALLIHTA